MANALLLMALLVAGCVVLASATTHTVSDWQGWTIHVDYSAWASCKSFAVGDKLVFNYYNKAHTVTEVSQSGYDSCSGVNALSNDESGSTVMTLKYSGTHYFICNVTSLCANGMKLAVAVSDAPSSASALQVSVMASVVAAAAAVAIKLVLF